MSKHAMTAAERAHIERVKQLDCQCCGAAGPCDAHHPREGQGMSQRAGHFTAMALCKACHQGPLGVHGDKTLMRIHKVMEMDMVDSTIGEIMKGLI